MPIAVTLDKQYPFIIEQDRGSEIETVFFLKPMRRADRKAFEERTFRLIKGAGAMRAEGGVDLSRLSEKQFGEMREISRAKVKQFLGGWSNFFDCDGEEVPMIPDENGQVSEESLDLIEPYVEELAAAIDSHNVVKPGELKN